MASYEDAWLRENDQTHRPGLNSIFFNRAHRSSTSNSTSSSSDYYTSTHFIAMREPQRRFQAFFVGKVKYFFTKTIFFVDSLAPYVHFHKENGFPFTMKPWVGTRLDPKSDGNIYSPFLSLMSMFLNRGSILCLSPTLVVPLES